MSNLPTLDEIGLKHKTDKASSTHDYLRIYEPFIAHWRDEPIKILEIGVLYGGSIKVWEEYFPKSSIVGADINPVVQRFSRDRVAIELIDQSNIEELTQLGVKHGPFDLVIEDGSHFWEHQITSLKTVFPFVKNGGIYIIEDLQTNYGEGPNGFQGVATSTCMEYLKQLTDLRVASDQTPIDLVEDPFLRTYGRSIDFVTFLRHACILKKRLPTGKKYEPRVNGEPLASLTDSGRNDVPSVGVLAHVRKRGEVFGASGYVNALGSEIIQRVDFETDQEIFEYRVSSETGTWSVWTNSGRTAIGTKKFSQIVAAQVRTKPEFAGTYKVSLLARFNDSQNVVASDDTGTVSGSSALGGIQIIIEQYS